MKKGIIITAYVEGDVWTILKDIGICSKEDLSSYFVICADGGYDISGSAGIKPDLVIGDFDSVKSRTSPDDIIAENKSESIEVISHPVRKDFTDTGLALDMALQKELTDVIIIGGIGGRLDHTIANIQDIVGFTLKGMKITIVDEQNSLTVLSSCHTTYQCDTLEIDINAAKYVSLFSYSDKAIVSISGVDYPLRHHTLTNSFPLGVSNKIVDENAEIKLHDGILIVTKYK